MQYAREPTLEKKNPTQMHLVSNSDPRTQDDYVVPFTNHVTMAFQNDC